MSQFLMDTSEGTITLIYSNSSNSFAIHAKHRRSNLWPRHTQKHLYGTGWPVNAGSNCNLIISYECCSIHNCSTGQMNLRENSGYCRRSFTRLVEPQTWFTNRLYSQVAVSVWNYGEQWCKYSLVMITVRLTVWPTEWLSYKIKQNDFAAVQTLSGTFI